MKSLDKEYYSLSEKLLENGADSRIALRDVLSDPTTETMERNSNFLIEHLPDVNEVIDYGSFLSLAVRTGNKNIVQSLLNKGANPNLKIGRPPLFYAIDRENVEMTEILLKAKADPNQDNDGLENLVKNKYERIAQEEPYLDRVLDYYNKKEGGSRPVSPTVDNSSIGYDPFGDIDSEGGSRPVSPTADNSSIGVVELSDAAKIAKMLIDAGAKMSDIAKNMVKNGYTSDPSLSAVLSEEIAKQEQNKSLEEKAKDATAYISKYLSEAKTPSRSPSPGDKKDESRGRSDSFK